MAVLLRRGSDQCQQPCQSVLTVKKGRNLRPRRIADAKELPGKLAQALTVFLLCYATLSKLSDRKSVV